jgi:superfamily II DNA or RNA helicase
MPQNQNKGGFTLRKGQQAVIDLISQRPDLKVFPAKLPGGYGKSLVIAATYQLKRSLGECDRLLIIVANDRQRRQILNDFEADCRMIDLEIPGGVYQFDSTPATIEASIKNVCEVFVTTIQTVSSTKRVCASPTIDKPDVDSLLNLMLKKGRWMVAADEYHHYASEQDWGEALKRIVEKSRFALALSATPDRDGMPTIFGGPKVDVTYWEGFEEKALKQLKLESYQYAVNVFTRTGKATYTTDQLRGIAKLPNGINAFEEKEAIRYNTNYIHPILTGPLNRLVEQQLHTRKKLQALVRAMSCNHAQAICAQIKDLYPDMAVDWVGTGPNGRSDQDNESVCEKFCPRKGNDGRRPEPELDVLVQVGMAGEGLDCIPVTEIIDLSLATLEGASNASKQLYLRGARRVPGLPDAYQVCTINVPTDHPLDGLEEHIMSWIDNGNGMPGKLPITEEDNNQRKLQKPEPLPEDWVGNVVREVEFIEVRVDSAAFQEFKSSAAVPFSFGKVEFDENNPEHLNKVIEMYRAAHRAASPKPSEYLVCAKLKQEIDKLTGLIANWVAARENESKDVKLGPIIGAYKRNIHARLKRRFGPKESLLSDGLKEELEYLRVLHNQIIDGDIPAWVYAK